MQKRSFLSYLRRPGFTLPEILVSISLVAVLAAVVVPSIASQARKGDPTRVGNDLLGIRGGVEQFLTDVRRYPGGITQLTAPIALTDKPLSGTVASTYVFGAAEVGRWRGPYLSKDGTAALTTGFGWSFKQGFDYDGYGVSGTIGVSTAQKYVVLAIGVTDVASAQQLDAMFDDGDLTAGLIRYRVCTAAPACTGTPPDTVKFLLMPIY